jgi:hypothetical protein
MMDENAAYPARVSIRANEHVLPPEPALVFPFAPRPGLVISRL